MECEQRRWGGEDARSGVELENADLVLVFGDRDRLRDSAVLAEIADHYPSAIVTGCSTAGEILGRAVSDNGVCTTALKFDKTRVAAHVASISESSSRVAGKNLGKALAGESLSHVFVLSEGITVNGSELVRGLEDALPDGVTITGGLSGDGERFEQTGVVWNGELCTGLVVAIGLYGDHLKVGSGTYGGWDAFGPERTITRSRGPVLLELDGRPALELYKKYLGEFADGLPATGLLFPLSLRERPGQTGRVRTILGVDEEVGALVFAGDVPEGSYVRLMMASLDRLIEGAAEAARSALADATSPQLAVLVSCVGRKLVLRQRIEEELDAVGDVLVGATLAGFYSYGEIAPFESAARCELHNQTMTITTISET